MKNVTGCVLGLALAALTVGRVSPQATAPVRSHSISPAEYERWKKELSNWGRWGKDDQIGALNLITPAKRKQAAST